MTDKLIIKKWFRTVLRKPVITTQSSSPLISFQLKEVGLVYILCCITNGKLGCFKFQKQQFKMELHYVKQQTQLHISAGEATHINQHTSHQHLTHNSPTMSVRHESLITSARSRAQKLLHRHH